MTFYNVDGSPASLTPQQNQELQNEVVRIRSGQPANPSLPKLTFGRPNAAPPDATIDTRRNAPAEASVAAPANAAAEVPPSGPVQREAPKDEFEEVKAALLERANILRESKIFVSAGTYDILVQQISDSKNKWDIQAIDERVAKYEKELAERDADISREASRLAAEAGGGGDKPPEPPDDGTPPETPADPPPPGRIPRWRNNPPPRRNSEALSLEDEAVAFRQRFEEEETGSRAGRVARGGGGERGRDRDRGGWGSLPPLDDDARDLRQEEIQKQPDLEKNFLLVVERLAGERGKETYGKWVKEEVLESQHTEFLAYARREFVNRLAMGESLQKRLSLSDLAVAKRRNQALRNEVDLRSDEAAMKVIKEQAMRLAMTLDGHEVRRYVGAYDILDTKRATHEYKKWEKDFQDFLARTGMSHEQYDRLVQIESEQERSATRDALEQRMKKGQSTVRSVFSWALPSQGEKMLKRATSIEDRLIKPGHVSDVDEQLRSVTDFMMLSLTHDPEVRRAFQQSAALAEEVKAPDTRPMTFREMRGESTRLTERVSGKTELSTAALQRRFDREKVFVRSRDGTRGWGDMNADERRDWRDNTWNPPEMRDARTQESGGAGFWSSVKAWLLELLMSKKKKEIKVE